MQESARSIWIESGEIHSSYDIIHEAFLKRKKKRGENPRSRETGEAYSFLNIGETVTFRKFFRYINGKACNRKNQKQRRKRRVFNNPVIRACNNWTKRMQPFVAVGSLGGIFGHRFASGPDCFAGSDIRRYAHERNVTEPRHRTLLLRGGADFLSACAPDSCSAVQISPGETASAPPLKE